MDRAAVDAYAGLERPPMRVKAGEQRQQRRMDVQHPSGPAVDEPRRQDAHEAGKAEELDAMRQKLSVERALQSLALRIDLVVDDRGCDPGGRRPREAFRVRPVRDHQRVLGRVLRRLGGLYQRRHVRAAAGNEDGDTALSGRRQCQILKPPVVRTGSPSGAATTSPMRTGFCPAATNAAATCSSSAVPTMAIMPMPQLKVRSISAAATPPVLASQPNTGGTGIASRSSCTPTPFGRTRGILSGKPPPVMWTSPLTAPVARMAARTGFT